MGGSMKSRGYFGMGVYHPKNEINIGTLYRSAHIYGVDFIFTIGRRYHQQAGDTTKAFRHTPLWNFASWQEFVDHIPYTAQIVCVEQSLHSMPLPNFVHPERAVYVLGAEDNGIPAEYLSRYQTIEIPSINPMCMNVAVAGSIILYDRFQKSHVVGELAA
jgi:tRNA G18 (ribose-2'-O)-methylase SpoU